LRHPYEQTVKSQGLSKQLQREIKAHPVKAGVLALALAVGIWFWAPLVVGMFGGSGKPKKPAAAAATGPAGVAAAQTAPTVAGKSQVNWNPSWREISEWVRQDEQMVPAAAMDQQRDPFRVVLPPVSESQVKQQAAPQLDVNNLGLELTGTLIGPRQSVAMINGRAYVLKHRAGSKKPQPLQIHIRQQDQDYEFKLLSIAPGLVELEYQNQSLTLKANDKQLTQKTIQLDERSTIELHGRVSLP